MTRRSWLSGLVALIASGPFAAGRAGAQPASSSAPTGTAASTAAGAAAPVFPFPLIPKPSSGSALTGAFTLNGGTNIITTNDARGVGAYLAQVLAPATGFALRVRQPPTPKSNAIVIDTDNTLDHLGEEGYSLVITPDRVVIRAFAPAGAFYAAQTLRQLLPAAIFGSTRVDTPWTLPALTMEDVPRFAWRGLMLDACRHFVPKAEVLKIIDLLALHKMNTLHWHLTDDQGWRIEIKKYPKLTTVGSMRKETRVGHEERPEGFDGTPHGGFYTQGDIREVVAYAKSRFVNLVPEIEMPGHAQAAIAAYPELGNTSQPVEVGTVWGVYPHIFNPSDHTIQFLQDVLSEVLTLFPGRFIHIGGDEAVKDEWKASAVAQARIKELGLKNEEELQGYIIREMDAFLAKRGRRLIGWDEILEGGLAPGATVMSWRGDAGGIAAARAGHDVVMAPEQFVYFNHAQSRAGGEPLSFGGFTPLEKVYGFEPVPAALTPAEATRVLGAQGQLWSEYIPTPALLEYMAFPRAAALAEVTWSAKEGRSFDDFRARLAAHEARLSKLGVNFRPLARS